MTGSIVQKGNKYYIIVDIYDDKGKRKRKWISGFDKKSEAQLALPRILTEIQDGKFIDTDNITVRDYLKLFLQDYAKPNLAATTYDKYYYASKKISKIIGNMKLQKLKPIHVQNMMNKLNGQDIKPSTIQSYFRMFSTALNQAIKWQIILNNPCLAISPPRQEKEKLKVLNPEQIQILIESSKEHAIYPVIMLGLMCGMRRGEILGLTWDNVDLVSGKIYIQSNMVQAGKEIIVKETKTSTGTRSVDISSKLIQFLKSLKKQQIENKLLFGEKYIDNNFVCKWMDGNTFRPDYIPSAFKKILIKAELPQIRFHDLRHTHASMLLLAGENPKVVQERLGHSSIKITLDTYSHLIPTMQKSAADKMEGLVDF